MARLVVGLVVLLLVGVVVGGGWLAMTDMQPAMKTVRVDVPDASLPR